MAKATFCYVVFGKRSLEHLSFEGADETLCGKDSGFVQPVAHEFDPRWLTNTAWYCKRCAAKAEVIAKYVNK
jgi:hypothetical protein